MKDIRHTYLRILLALFACLISVFSFGIELPDSISTTSENVTNTSENENLEVLRHFDISDADIFNSTERFESINEVEALQEVEPANPLEQHAESLMDKVKSENRFVKFLDATALVDLPIGLVA